MATAPSPAASGTSLVVSAGQGALFPTAPFNCTVWPDGETPTSANAEIVRVTAVVTDTLTIVRTQEGTSARSIIVGDQIANTITAKVFTDIEPQFGAADPNGSVSGARGQLYKNTTTGEMYINTDGGTTWV